MKRVSMVLVGLFLLGIVLSGCSRRQQAWEKAHDADTVESYQAFVKEFADGEFVSQAQARIKEIEEDRDWQQAQATNTEEGYRQFLAKHAEGRQSDEARIRLESFELARTSSEPAALSGSMPGDSASGEVLGPEDSASLSADAADGMSTAKPSSAPVPAQPKATSVPKPTAPKPAAPKSASTPKSAPAKALAAASAGKGYRIQLGAFSGGDKQAMSEWRRLQREYPKLLGSMSPSVKVVTTSSGHLYRLQAGMTNETRAREICTALKAKKQSCVVVLP